jgi:hypothetical protein
VKGVEGVRGAEGQEEVWVGSQRGGGRGGPLHVGILVVIEEAQVEIEEDLTVFLEL